MSNLSEPATSELMDFRYQSLINLYLRDCAQHRKKLELKRFSGSGEDMPKLSSQPGTHNSHLLVPIVLL